MDAQHGRADETKTRAPLVGELDRGGQAVGCTVDVRWAGDDADGRRSLLLAISSEDGGDEGSVHVAPVAFMEATVWLRGAVDGSWHDADDAAAPHLDDVVLVAGDADVTRICDSQMNRVLPVPTEAFQAAVYAGDRAHRTVQLTNPMFGPDPIAVDRGIAELVELVWGLEIATTNSCENQDGAVVLTFQEAAGAEQFATAVAIQVRPDDAVAIGVEDLYNRIAIELEPDEGWQRFRRRRVWNFGAAHGTDFGGPVGDGGGASFRGACDVGVGISVRFPREDLPMVVAALQRAASNGT